MIDEHIKKSIRNQERKSPGGEESRVVSLVPKLKSAIGGISKTHDERAETIAQMAAASADRAMTAERQADGGETNVHGLIESVEGFEASRSATGRSGEPIRHRLEQHGRLKEAD